MIGDKAKIKGKKKKNIAEIEYKLHKCNPGNMITTFPSVYQPWVIPLMTFSMEQEYITSTRSMTFLAGKTNFFFCFTESEMKHSLLKESKKKG